MFRSLSALGSFTYRFRKAIVLFWSLLFVFLLFFALQLPSVLRGNGFTMDGSFATTSQLLKEEFGIYESTLIVLLEKKPEADGEQFSQTLAKTIEQLEAMQLEGLIAIKSALPTEDTPPNPGMITDDAAYLQLSFDLSSSELAGTITDIRQTLSELSPAYATFGVTGGPAIEQDLNTASQNDLTKAEMIGLPIAMIILLLAFGGLIAAGLPLVVGLFSVVSAMGALYFAGTQMELSIFLLNVVLMLGLALGIDFALLFVNRFRQELDKGSVERAVVRSVQTAGESIFVSGLCVMIGLTALLFIRVDLFQAVALGGITVVLFSMLIALTLLPALLSMLGTNVNRLMLFKPRPERASGWLRFARMVMKRPLLMAGTALIILVAGMLPIGGMDLQIPGSDSLPERYESRSAYDAYEAHFYNPDSAHLVIVAQADSDMTEDAALSALETYVTALHEDPLVGQVDSIFSATSTDSAEQLAQMTADPNLAPLVAPAFDQLTNGHYALLQVELLAPSGDDVTKQWLRDAEQQNLSELTLYIGGYAKFSQEIFDEIASKIGYSVLLIAVATYLILFIAFRSVLIPLKAILMNALSLGATFGLVVLMFQNDLGMGEASIALFIPIFIFSIVFGLSTDYEVFLISRIQEIYEAEGDNDEATIQGLALTSKIITSAAAIMIVVTGAFAFTDVMPIKQLGVGIALAIFIDATIVRMILVPSMMKLLGRWNWWAPAIFRKKKTATSASKSH